MWAERERQRNAVRTVDGEALLLSLLPPKERARYRYAREFFVTGSEGGLYLVRHGYIGNVHRMPSGQSLCAHPPIWRDADVETSLVTQLLLISTDENAFLAKANRL